MFEALTEGLFQLANLDYLVMLVFGVVLGLAAGVIPGIGGSMGLALVLPFIFRFEAQAAIGILIGLVAVTTTSDTITCVLLSIPGSAGSVATIIDGYPMARKGEAGRALSAAFWASALGGVGGALLLALSVPIARTLLRQFGSPEFFMFTILGISMASTLSGPRPIKGLIAGCLGLLLVSVGTAPGTAFVRYTLGSLYLYSGIPLIVLVLGVFGIPELVDLMIKGTPIAGRISINKGILDGIKDVIKAKWLVLRCTLLGTFIGFLPGLGTSPANWLAYGHTVQSAKDKSGFGKGDVRGVIGPEAANNAARGGELIPTLLFGIPGSSSMAILMIGMTVFGVHAGPEMMTKHLSIVYQIVWSLAAASILGTILCTALANPLARVSTIPIHILAPYILMIIVIGAYQTSHHWGDLILLLVFGVIGWLLKRLEFSRPALLIGFVLGGIAERYLGLSVGRYGMMWLLRPWVIVIGITITVSLIMAIRWQHGRRSAEQAIPYKEDK
jgi:TctA family transporter